MFSKKETKTSARDFQSSFGRILGGSKLSLHQKSDNILSSPYKKYNPMSCIYLMFKKKILYHVHRLGGGMW